MEVMKKVNVNIPLLEMIDQMPKFAKMLKDLCDPKKKIKVEEVIPLTENISAIIQRWLP